MHALRPEKEKEVPKVVSSDDLHGLHEQTGATDMAGGSSTYYKGIQRADDEQQHCDLFVVKTILASKEAVAQRNGRL